MPKSTKRFVLSNERLNSHGFVVITSGIDIADFLKNPVMHWMHSAPSEKDPTNGLPIGYWTDVERNDKQLTAVPFFDDSDEFAMKIYNKVEHGTLRAASVALGEPALFDDNKANWVSGQTAPTVLKCKLCEASIVDRGSNADAVVVNLSNSYPTYLKLSLKEQNNIKTITSESMEQDKKQPLKNDAAVSPEMQAITKNAVDAGKYKQQEVDMMLGISDGSDEINDTIKGLIRKAPIKPDLIEGKYHRAYIKKAAEKTFDQISDEGDTQLRDMKANAPELYKAKFFEKYGRMPAGVN